MEAAEAHLELIRGFVNTVDVESGTDALDDLASYRQWARGVGVPEPSDAQELSTARSVRSALRAVLALHHGPDGQAPDPQAKAAFEHAAEAVRLRVGLDGRGLPVAVPVQGGALGPVLAALIAVGTQETFSRLKLCPEAGCRWAFIDRSRNRSRRWCDMRVCGNRTKARTYRQRSGRPS